MEPKEIKRLIEAGIQDSTAFVTGESGKYEATVVSPTFTGLSPVKMHQLVYSTVNEHIQSGALHALSIKTYTPQAWQALQEK
jgi:acid stress-induced BolA-like protein IbaG/YrbA